MDLIKKRNTNPLARQPSSVQLFPTIEAKDFVKHSIFNIVRYGSQVVYNS